MNAHMTRRTQYSQVRQLIVFMASINMMYLQVFCATANKTPVWIVMKSSFSVIPAAFSIVGIVTSASFKRVKGRLFALSRAKFRRIFPRSLGFENRATDRASNFNLCIPSCSFLLPTRSRAKMNSSRFLFGNITRALQEFNTTVFAKKRNKFVARVFVTCAGTKLCSPSLNWLLASGAILHRESLSLATAKVNQKYGGTKWLNIA